MPLCDACFNYFLISDAGDIKPEVPYMYCTYTLHQQKELSILLENKKRLHCQKIERFNTIRKKRF